MNPNALPNWFNQQSEDKQENTLLRFSHGIESLEISLENIKKVALGLDPLNEPKDV